MRNTRTLTIGLAAASLLLVGCTASPDTEPGGGTAEEVAEGFLAVADDSLAAGGTLSVYLDYDSVEANGLNPQTADTARSWMIMGLAYDTLVGIDENFEPTPRIAESWEIVSPTEYVFTLRDDVVFSNGRSMTADDVAGSLELLRGSGGAWSGQVSAIDTVDVTGEHEVTITLSRPSTPLLGALAHTATAILPIEEIEAGTVDITQEMVGTGPYVATRHVQDESWTFEKNAEHYAADTLGIDTLEIRIVPDESSRLAAMRDGSADYAFFNNADALDLLAGTPEARVVNQQNTDFFYVILNSRDENSPLADERVRFAVNAAIDRTQLAELASAGTAIPTGITPVALPGACDPSALPSAQLSDDEIRGLLAEAGAEDITLRLITWNSEVGPGAIAQVIQQRLAEFGITLELEIVDDGIWVEAAYGDPAVPMTHDLGISWYAGYGDASMVTNWWNTDTAGFTGRFMGGSAELNGLIVAAAEEPAGASRDALLADVCAEADQLAEKVALINRPGVIAYRSDAVSPTINSNEGYGNILRYIADFRMTGAE